MLRQHACLQWRSHVGDLLQDLDDVLAARGRETAAMPAHHFRYEATSQASMLQQLQQVPV